MKFWKELQTEIDEFRKRIYDRVYDFTCKLDQTHSEDFQRAANSVQRSCYLGASSETGDPLLASPTLFVLFPHMYPYDRALKECDDVMKALGEFVSNCRLTVKVTYQRPEKFVALYEPKG
jgi:hypothetical protein